MSWKKVSYQKLSTVLKNQPDGWLWTDVDENFANAVKKEVEDYFYERYINSIKPETFKRYFSTYCNLYYTPFLKMYDVFITDFDPLASRIYHENYNNSTTRDNRHNTLTDSTQTNNLNEKTTRTDALKSTQTSNVTRTDDLTTTLHNENTRTDNLDQTTTHAGTDTTTHSGTSSSNTSYQDTTNQKNKNLHSDMPQSNVASSTTGFPDVTWTYASDMQDTQGQNISDGHNNTSNEQDLTDRTTYDSDIMVNNTGTQTTESDGTQHNDGTQTTDGRQTTDNTGTQTTDVTHKGDIKNNTSSNLTIDDNENTNGERDIKEQSITATEAYSNYWRYLKNSNAWVWLMSKLDQTFLAILSYELEDDYEAGYVYERG